MITTLLDLVFVITTKRKLTGAGTHSMLTTIRHTNTMTTKPLHLAFKTSRIAASVGFTLTLVACGDSDLEQIHEDRIEAAAIQASEAELLPVAEVPTVDEEIVAPVVSEEVEVPAVDVEETEVPIGAALPESTIATPPPSAATREAINVDEFDLVFNDEFNTNELDDSKWNTAMAWGTDFVINDEQQFYVDTQSNPDSEFNPFSFDGESLTISAIATPESMGSIANGQPYVSGALTTLDKFDLSYGYIEARIDVPAGSGIWPSLWMLGTEFVDLKPQLYMMEFNGGIPNSFFHNYNYTDADGNLRSPMQHEVVVNGASEGWQTIGVRWSVDELVYYINGFPTFQVNGENVPSQAMYWIMNLAVGGLWVDETDETTPVPAPFKIDYVRMYQRN